MLARALLAAHQVIGVLAVLPSRPERLLIPEQRHLLETFAGQIASALERDGAVIVSDVDKVIAQMAENGAIPKGTIVSPDRYLLPRELGGLSR